MKDHLSIGAPAQLDDISLIHSHKPHVFGHAAVFDPNIEDLLCSAGADRQPQQQNRQRASAHHANSGQDASRIFHRTGWDLTSEMRLSIQPASLGDGSMAASLSADHISLPNPSVKPPIGFHAATGEVSIPSASQPFQGKSFSF